MYELSYNGPLQWALCLTPANPRPLHITFVIQVVASGNKTNHVPNNINVPSGTNSDEPLDPDEIMDDIDDIMDVEEDVSKQAAEEEDKMDIDQGLNAGHLAPMDLLMERFSAVMCPGSWMDDT
ncbi:hypothetical protein C8R41DRAFT_864020 [Lentinula lateritia]|uniref:Uncharacterized protein n=1 Tax=Lentinula lateritia TaxID=40482 RepID=A0ABQ8VTD1_9AGAR|nr:hypothetical protein C8R41DRAFT_864020 [Lentinula lateritia]